jgi:hypothetical protein
VQGIKEVADPVRMQSQFAAKLLAAHSFFRQDAKQFQLNRSE